MPRSLALEQARELVTASADGRVRWIDEQVERSQDDLRPE